MARMSKVIEALEAERAQAASHLAWIDEQLATFREHAASGAVGEAPARPPARSTRRQTAKRASTRRASARQVKRDAGADIIAYVTKHPGSTAGDVAKGLNLNRNSVATKLSVLVKAGELTKADRGYAPKS